MTLHGTLGKIIFSKKLPQNFFKICLDVFGNDFVLFWNFEKFWFFEIISKTRPYMEHWAKKTFEKITPKHVQNTFGHFWERLWAFLELWKILIFWDHFEDSTLHGTLGKKNFSIKLPQNKFKTRLDTFGNDFGHFFEVWKFFKNISKTRHSLEHWAKKFFKKLPQSMFKTRLVTFRNDFDHFWNFENFLKTFRRLDTPWNTGQKKSFGKITPKHVQNTFGQIGNDFGRFLNFENFLKTFRRLDPPWNTAQKKFPEKVPQNMFKTLLDNLGTTSGVFGILKFFKFF